MSKSGTIKLGRWIALAIGAVSLVGWTIHTRELHAATAGGQMGNTTQAVGQPPTPADKGMIGVTLIWIKDWDKYREHEARTSEMQKQYGVHLLHRYVVAPNPQAPALPEFGNPDLVEVWHLDDPMTLMRAFQDPKVQEASQWRDQYATRRIVMLPGMSTVPLTNLKFIEHPFPQARR